MVTWVLLCFLFLIFVKYIWNRRWLYYYSSKLKGPFSWPIIGSVHLFLGGEKEFSNKLLELADSYPPLFKVWLGPDLVFVTSQPNEIEIILNSCLKKSKYYEFAKGITQEGLLIAPIPKWKKNRKIINPTFNSNVFSLMFDVFNRNSKKLVATLQNDLHRESFDISSKIFRCTLDTAIETLMDVDEDLIEGQDNFIKNLLKMEELATLRVFKIWLHIEYFFKRSSMGKEFMKLVKENYNFTKKIVSIKKSQLANNDGCHQKFFLNHLFHIQQSQNLLTEEEICEETQTMLVTASETTALMISMVLLLLGIRQDLQEMLKKEQNLIFGDNDRDVTLDDINEMIHLDCVIKETLRLFPVAPVILRTVEKTIKFESHTIPAGSTVAVPIIITHKRPDFWKNPLEFNPERFLNREEQKLPRCAFVPFGHGIRNCIGMKYGMLSIKIFLSTLLRHYNFHSTHYEKLDDIELILAVVAKPSKGYNVKITSKNNNQCKIHM